MKVGAPQPGTIIRYSYLWESENAAGQREGRKDRPALIMMIALVRRDGETEVLALPITHTPPENPTDAIAIPASVKRDLGLDDDPSFIVTIEANIFTWPGPDLRRVPYRLPPSTVYGRIPDSLLKHVAAQVLRNYKTRMRIVRRTT